MTREELMKKIAGADVVSGGNNLRDGLYRLALRKFELTDGFKGARAVFEFVVISSRKKPVSEIKTGKPLDIEPNPIGSDVSIVNMLDKHESAFGNVKGAILGVFGETEASDDEVLAVMKTMIDDNSAYGRVVDVDTYRKVTKTNGVEIVLPKWYGVEQSDEDIAKMRDYLNQLAGRPPASVTA